MHSNKNCKTCQYRAADQASNGCDYYLITGELRGCPVKDCDKYIKGEKIKLKGEMKAEVVPGWLRGTYKVKKEEEWR